VPASGTRAIAAASMVTATRPRCSIPTAYTPSRPISEMAATIAKVYNDGGIGLLEEFSRPGHFGLRGLAERVAHLGGTLTIGNRETRGACLTAEIPLAAAS